MKCKPLCRTFSVPSSIDFVLCVPVYVIRASTAHLAWVRDFATGYSHLYINATFLGRFEPSSSLPLSLSLSLSLSFSLPPFLSLSLPLSFFADMFLQVPARVSVHM